jgi:hypothetical protein
MGIQAVYYLGGALLVLAAVIGWNGIRSGVEPSSAPSTPSSADVGPAEVVISRGAGL